MCPPAPRGPAAVPEQRSAPGRQRWGMWGEPRGRHVLLLEAGGQDRSGASLISPHGACSATGGAQPRLAVGPVPPMLNGKAAANVFLLLGNLQKHEGNIGKTSAGLGAVPASSLPGKLLSQLFIFKGFLVVFSRST